MCTNNKKRMKKIIFVCFVLLTASLNVFAQAKYVDEKGTLTDTSSMLSPYLKKTSIVGTANYVPLFTGTNSLDKSVMYQNLSRIGIGTITPTGTLHVYASGNTTIPTTAATTASTIPLVKFQTTNTSLGMFTANASPWTFGWQSYENTTGTAVPMALQPVSGNVGIGTISPNTKLEISSGTAGSSGLRFTNLTNTTAGTSTFSGILGLNSTGDVGIASLTGSSISGLTVGRVTYGGSTGNLAQSSSFFWDQTNNRLGIGTTIPSTNLHINSSLAATNTINADAQVLRLSRPTNSGVKWDNIAQFNLGSYSTGGIANSRLDLDMNDGGSTTTSNVMTWQADGKIGIGLTAPGSKLEMVQNSSYTGTETSGHGLQIVTGKTISTDYTLYMGADKTNALSYLQSVKWGSTTAPLVLNGRGGTVSVGSSANKASFEVNGSATNATSYNAGAATAIIFSNSNLAYTTASAGAFNLQGMKDGGTYTLAVQGTTSGTSSFLGLNPSGTAFSFKNINNGATTAGKHTLYTFIVIGTNVYFYMATGF